MSYVIAGSMFLIGAVIGFIYAAVLCANRIHDLEAGDRR